MKVVLAGGNGALGRRIAADLAARGDEIVVLSRSPDPSGTGRQLRWDGAGQGAWATELAGSAVINLAGELVDRRPSPMNIELLTSSRVRPTRALRQAAAGPAGPPAVWIQMSTLAIYGDAGDTILDETAVPADGPAQMAGVARAWETAAKGVTAGRQVVLRTAVVLDRGTPAYARLTALTRWGLGGRMGSGKQWISWLHIEDFLAIIRFCLDDAELAGVVHATSPEPVTNAEFMAAMRRTWNRPAAPPAPASLVRLGTVLLGSDPALALTGRRCAPGRLAEPGFGFKYPDIEGALGSLRATDRRNGGEQVTLPRGLAARLTHPFIGECIGALIARIARVSLDPEPDHLMPADGRFESLPQVRVLDRLLVRCSPAITFPFRQPRGDSVPKVGTVRMEPDRRRPGQALQRLDGCHQFHPVVGGAAALAAADLLGVRAVPEHCPPAARTWISAARPVGIDLHRRRALLFATCHRARLTRLVLIAKRMLDTPWSHEDLGEPCYWAAGLRRLRLAEAD